MKINVLTNYYGFDIPKVEEKYNAKYLGDFCTKNRHGGWNERPVSVFYVENPDREKGHSNYFGLFINRALLPDGEDTVFITDGQSAFEEDLKGIQSDDGEIYISCYRHHYVESKDKSVFIDGGRDYTRHTPDKNLVTVKVEKDQFVIL